MTYKSHTALLDYLVSTMNPHLALPVLDLACGKGRSGLILARRGIRPAKQPGLPSRAG